MVVAPQREPRATADHAATNACESNDDRASIAVTAFASVSARRPIAAIASGVPFSSSHWISCLDSASPIVLGRHAVSAIMARARERRTNTTGEGSPGPGR
jgi:hypothetical protein